MHIHEEPCAINAFFASRKPDGDRALMGPAHAASGAGISLLLLGLLAYFEVITDSWISSFFAITLIALVFTGAALVPDLDNTTSTVRSTLGLLGSALTTLFRSSSLVLQTVVRTRRDDPSPDPHRGFWHSILGALTLGGIVSLFTLIPGEFTVAGVVITNAKLAIAIIATIFVRLALAGIAQKEMKKLTGEHFSELIGLLFAAALTVSCMWFLPEEFDLKLVAAAVAVGAIVHIFGDALTKAGVPIFFPITGFTRGKFWWKTRFAKFSADNEVLNSVVSILSIAAAVIGVVLLVLAQFQ